MDMRESEQNLKADVGRDDVAQDTESRATVGRRRYGRWKWIFASIGVVLVMALISRKGPVEALFTLLLYLVQGGVVPCVLLLVAAEIHGRRRRARDELQGREGGASVREEGEMLAGSVHSSSADQRSDKEKVSLRDVEGLLFWGWLLFLMMACFFLFDRGEIAATNGFGVNFR
jgi:hypothetical protein